MPRVSIEFDVRDAEAVGPAARELVQLPPVKLCMLRGVADTKRVLQGAACRQPREHRGTTIAEVTRTALEEHIGPARVWATVRDASVTRAAAWQSPKVDDAGSPVTLAASWRGYGRSAHA